MIINSRNIDLKLLKEIGIKIEKIENVEGKNFPDFLIVGPQRTGTTWLSNTLSAIPFFFMSAPKEIHYFNLLKAPWHPLYQSNIFEWYLHHFDEEKLMIKGVDSPSDNFCGQRYFGEATASYAVLDPKTIEGICAINKNIKIIINVRDPVDRAWSHAKKDLLRNRNKKIEEVSEFDFMDFLGSDYQLSCGFYTNIIDNWKNYICKENILILPFIDIAENPYEYIKKVMEFFDISESCLCELQDINKKVNYTNEQDMPDFVSRYLNKVFFGEVKYWKSKGYI